MRTRIKFCYAMIKTMLALIFIAGEMKRNSFLLTFLLHFLCFDE